RVIKGTGRGQSPACRVVGRGVRDRGRFSVACSRRSKGDRLPANYFRPHSPRRRTDVLLGTGFDHPIVGSIAPLQQGGDGETRARRLALFKTNIAYPLDFRWPNDGI
ncbi:unnamed protein product, partial [Ectocarpus fasciculatus]